MLEHTLYRIPVTSSRIKNWVPQLTKVSINQSPASTVQRLKPSVQGSASTMQLPASSVQSTESSFQSPAFRVQRPEYSVQCPLASVQRPASRVQRPGSRVQRPESSVQTLVSRVREFRYARFCLVIRKLFWIQSNICDGAYYENRQRLKAIS